MASSFGWAGGVKHAARGSGRRQRQAAGGRRRAAGGRRLPTKHVQVGVVTCAGRARGAPDEACTGRRPSGPARTSRASRRRSAPRVCTKGWSVVEMERGGALPAAPGEVHVGGGGDGEHAAHARCIALEGRCLEQVVAVEKSQIPIFKNLERRIPRRRTSWRPRVGGGGAE